MGPKGLHDLKFEPAEFGFGHWSSTISVWNATTAVGNLQAVRSRASCAFQMERVVAAVNAARPGSYTEVEIPQL